MPLAVFRKAIPRAVRTVRRSRMVRDKGRLVKLPLYALLSCVFFLTQLARADDQSGRAWLGVAMSPGAGGVIVDFVFKTSPAAKAAIREGDVLLSADKVPLERPKDLVDLVARYKPGTRMAIALKRDGIDRTALVVLAKHPGDNEVHRLMHIGSDAYELEMLSAVQGAVPSGVADLKGRVAIIDFFASSCVNCRSIAPDLAAWHKKFQGRGLTVLGVTSDSEEVAKETIRDWDIPYAVATDPTQQTHLGYRVSAIPALFFVDRKGVIREVSIGYDPGRRADIEKLIEKLLSQR